MQLLIHNKGQKRLRYYIIAIVRAILWVTLTECKQGTVSQKDISHSTPNSIDKLPTTLEEAITQKEQALEKAKQELIQVRTQLKSLSQHRDNSAGSAQSNVTSTLRREEGIDEQYLPTQTLEDAFSNSVDTRQEDGTSPEVLRALLSPIALGADNNRQAQMQCTTTMTSSDEPVDGCARRLEEYVAKVDNSLNTALEEFLEEASEHNDEQSQSTVSETLEKVQHDGNDRRESNRAPMQAFLGIPLAPPEELVRTPSTAASEMLDEEFSYSNGTRPQPDITALQPEVDRLSMHIMQLRQELDVLKARQQ